jgi:transcription-repair coupling factor (superfamily II helicase)
MKHIIESIQALPGFHTIVEAHSSGEKRQRLGLPRSARLGAAAALNRSLNRPLVLLAHRTDHALTLFDELDLWLPGEPAFRQAPRLYFPEPTSLFYENIAWGANMRQERLGVLSRLTFYETGEPAPIIVAPARAAMTQTISPEEFVAASFNLQAGERIVPNDLAQQWVKLGYEAASAVLAPGQFARRGGILDIWPAAANQPARIDFFGDEIDSLRRFDPNTQRTTETEEQLLIPPAREFLLTDAGDIGVEEGEEINEFHIPLLHTKPGGLLSYLPAEAILLIDDMELLAKTVEELEEQAVGLREDNVKDGSIPADFPTPYLTWVEIKEQIRDLQAIEFGPTDLDASELAKAFSPGQRFGGKLPDFIRHIEHRYQFGEEITVVSRQAARIQELWAETVIEDLADTPPRFVQGSLSEGFALDVPDRARMHLFTDSEIFGWRRPEFRRRPRIANQSPEGDYVDFQVNDLVVHLDHGVGIYKGLVERAMEGIAQEYLCVEYAGGDQLYVPVYQADRLTRYVGAKGYTPNLNRLGGIEWRNVKSRVSKAVEAVAEDLLELYAKRQIAKGKAFNADTPWQKELEASFPYVETEDQLRVVKEVKADMESKRPMDRLICGDVGYGKTEVALRAAFKAVMDGKQVAMLVPTTILAQQHYETFRERLAAFPTEVEMLSRFRTDKEQKDILERLATGTVDIVIGTHRLIQPDVQFKDLGLLIIDEEQRFGVTHKEYLKGLRSEVDVLTMTATPIPRTLYMALTSVRDISTINTPPEERLPIVTHIGPYSPRLVRQAILREIERGGQVFFVHNRVQTIDAIGKQLDTLIPEARVSIAHGQMNEQQLSARMKQFTNHEIDVLLTTSIIESGLDIPNANTLIVDRADTFGLAQLYQLRGRVGRGAQRAYAYFFKHRARRPTEDAAQRLETIAENTQLGAGYSIAMRDLEMRGAGDILGTRQHGHIAAVGFHLYTRLLNQAVQQLKEQGSLSPDAAMTTLTTYHPLVSVDLPMAVNIPQEYVPDKSMRLRLYRRMADIHNTGEIEALQEEFQDRFGELPKPVQNMFYQLKIKILAEKAGAASISIENRQIAIKYPPLEDGQKARNFPPLGRDTRGSKNTIWLRQDTEISWRERLVEILETLAQETTAPTSQPAKFDLAA